MKQKLKVFAAIAVLSTLTACHEAAPGAGEEAVLIRQPVFFGPGGIDPDPVKTGLKFVALSTSVQIVNMQPQQFILHFDDLMSSDGVPLDFDAALRLQITDSVKLISEFGTEWFQKNVGVEFSNRIRQAVRKHGMNETAIDTKAIDAIDAEVSAAMVTYLETAGIPVKLIDVTVGKANPPDSIKSQRISTATEQQRQLTEQQRKLAEDQRKEAEMSRAIADNAYREAMKLSPDQYLQLETIKMQQQACASGHCTFIVGGKVQPVLPVQ